MMRGKVYCDGLSGCSFNIPGNSEWRGYRTDMLIHHGASKKKYGRYIGDFGEKNILQLRNIRLMDYTRSMKIFSPYVSSNDWFNIVCTDRILTTWPNIPGLHWLHAIQIRILVYMDHCNQTYEDDIPFREDTIVPCGGEDEMFPGNELDAYFKDYYNKGITTWAEFRDRY